VQLAAKKGATRAAGANLLQQIAKFDAFLEFLPPYPAVPEPDYPLHGKTSSPAAAAFCGAAEFVGSASHFKTPVQIQPTSVRRALWFGMSDMGIFLTMKLIYGHAKPSTGHVAPRV